MNFPGRQGIQTRLEAFIDLIAAYSRNTGKVCCKGGLVFGNRCWICQYKFGFNRPEGELYLSPLYLRTQGQPIAGVQQGLALMEERLSSEDRICGAGTTGSARSLAGVLVGADIVKNEITSHAVAALREVPGVRTVIEIGGQDSKIIILRNGIVVILQ